MVRSKRLIGKASKEKEVHVPGGGKRTSQNSNQHLFHANMELTEPQLNSSPRAGSEVNAHTDTVVLNSPKHSTLVENRGTLPLRHPRNSSTPTRSSAASYQASRTPMSDLVDTPIGDGIAHSLIQDNQQDLFGSHNTEGSRIKAVTREVAQGYIEELVVRIEWFGMELVNDVDWEIKYQNIVIGIQNKIAKLSEIVRISSLGDLFMEVQGLKARFDIYKSHFHTISANSRPPSSITDRRRSPAYGSPEGAAGEVLPPQGTRLVIRQDSVCTGMQGAIGSVENLSTSRSDQLYHLRERLRKLTDTKGDRAEMQKQFRTANNKIAELKDCITHQQETISHMEEKILNLENIANLHHNQLGSIPEMQEALMEQTLKMEDAIECMESYRQEGLESTERMNDDQISIRRDLVRFNADMAQFQVRLDFHARSQSQRTQPPPYDSQHEPYHSVPIIRRPQSCGSVSSTSETLSPPAPRVNHMNPVGIVPLHLSQAINAPQNRNGSGSRANVPQAEQVQQVGQGQYHSRVAGHAPLYQSSSSESTLSWERGMNRPRRGMGHNRIHNIGVNTSQNRSNAPRLHINAPQQQAPGHGYMFGTSNEHDERGRKARRATKNITSQCRRLRSLMDVELNNELSKSHVQDLLKMTLPLINDVKKELKKEIDNYSSLPDYLVDSSIVDLAEDLMDQAHDWAITLKNVYTAIDCGKPSLDGKLFEGLKKFSETSELSIFEFIKKFERYTADKGSKLQKAALLYDQYIDKTLQLKAVDLRHDYDGLTNWLRLHYGKPRVMSKNLLKALPSASPPADSLVTAGLTHYYRSLEAAVKRIQELKDIPEMSEEMDTSWVESTDFLELLVGKLPRKSKKQFYTALIEKGKDVEHLHGLDIFEMMVETIKVSSKITEAMWKSAPEETTRSKPKDNTSPKLGNRVHIGTVGSPLQRTESPSQSNPTAHLARSSTPPKFKDKAKSNPMDSAKDGRMAKIIPKSKSEFPCVFERHTHELGQCVSFLTAGCRARRDLALGTICLTCLKPKDTCDRKCAPNVPEALKCKKCGENPKLKNYPPRCVLFCSEKDHKTDIDTAAFTSALEGYLKGISAGSIDGNAILEMD